jgi:CheY-like chemotaxis protein
VTVADDGPGIPSELRSTLFQPFQQVGRGNVDPSQGSGLGLAICALLARALDGEIMLVDDGLPGTRIDFSIHAFVAEESIARSLAGDDNSVDKADIVADTPRPCNILLVEDHNVNLKLLCELLAIDRHRVAAVRSGEEAIARIDAALSGAETAEREWLGDCDIVLMDLNLPGISGIEAVRELRRCYRERGKREPMFVALTASTREEVREDCSRVGVQRFITKPATLQQLRAVIDELPQASPEQDEKARATPILDPSVLARLLAVEANAPAPFVVNLVNEFLAVFDADVERLIAAISANNAREVKANAHALAGAALAVGARRLASVCREQTTTLSISQLRSVADETKAALTAWREHHLASSVLAHEKAQ